MDQTGDMRDATHEDIMKKAKAKYNLLVNNRKWATKSPDHVKISTLVAKIKKIKKLKDLKLSAHLICKLKEGDHNQKEEENNGWNGTREHSKRSAPTSGFNDRMKSERNHLPRKTIQSTSRWARKHFTGEFITRSGQYTSLKIVP